MAIKTIVKHHLLDERLTVLATGELLEALGFAYKRGIVHCNVTFANMMIEEDDGLQPARQRQQHAPPARRVRGGLLLTLSGAVDIR